MTASDQDRLVLEAQARVVAICEAAYETSEAVMRRAADEVDEIRLETLAATGVEILPPSPAQLRTVMDVPLGDLAGLAEKCHHLLAGVEMLGDHVQFGETRTVGVVVKAGIDIARASIALDFLRKSRFFADDGEATT